MLIPLKTGHMLLPNVDIRANIKPRDDAPSTKASEQTTLNCETDYLSYGESVVAIPDVMSSTVGIGDMGLPSVKSVVWLESKGLG